MYSSFKNPDLAKNLLTQIEKISKDLNKINLMEVCGTHTHAIAKAGLKNLLPKNVNLLSGPGCPVCVTPNSTIDEMVELSKNKNVIITTFGDMIRVPGNHSSLIKEKANGANVEIVYSPLDSIKIAQDNPNKEVVFLGVGFETTAPTTAATVLKAKNLTLKNWSLFCAHKNMPNALNLIANDDEINVDGLILPGHVSTIIGIEPYEFLISKYNISGVISGFEPVEILAAIKMLIDQKVNNTPKIENAYGRAVKSAGNTTAREITNTVFETCNSTWRGLGKIQNSGYKIKDNFKNFDAKLKLNIPDLKNTETPGCKCGEILRGKISPDKCPLFGKSCNPQNPIGPCMVSSEGSCSATYKYQLTN